jgi:hypothetical protein
MTEQLEAEKKEEFLREYRKLVEKYGYDWDFEASIVKVAPIKETIRNARK